MGHLAKQRDASFFVLFFKTCQYGVLTIVRSLKIAVPILNLRLFKNQAFAGHVLGFFLTQIISLGFAFLLPNYIQLVNGNSALLAGLLVLPAGFMGAFFGPFGGKLLD